VRHLAGEQAGIDARAEPEHLVRGLLLAAVGGRDQPPGRHCRRSVGRLRRAGARLARAAGQHPGLRGAGQHDAFDQVVRADDADRKLARWLALTGHRRSPWRETAVTNVLPAAAYCSW
jgi:hypothetical protein